MLSDCRMKWCSRGSRALVTFFVLETKKVTKENSRKKVLLRTFFHCSRTSSITTGFNILLHRYFPFKCFLTYGWRGAVDASAPIRNYCGRNIPTLIPYYKVFPQSSSG